MVEAGHYSYITNSYDLNKELFQEYKFVICFENTYEVDYITEKLPNAMMANSIGIYKGAPNIEEFFNIKSFINYDSYGNSDSIIDKIIELDKDEQKYKNFLKEPFFVNNELPARIKTAKNDLINFLDQLLLS